MTRRRALALSLLVVVAIAALLFALCRSEWIAIDSCLDRGGRWDYAVAECRMDAEV